MRNRITKGLAGLAALAALALGGATLASGQGSPKPANPAQPQSGTQADTDSIQDENGKDDATEPAGEEKDGAADTDSAQDENEKENTVPAGAIADKATAAALEATGGGKANGVERESETDEKGEKDEKSEKSEKGAAYEVEVTKPDGSTVGVHLDANYKVVSVDADSEQGESKG